MLTAIVKKLRDWYVVAIAACAIVAGLYLAGGPLTPPESAVHGSSTASQPSKTASPSPAPIAAQSSNARPAETTRPPAPATRPLKPTRSGAVEARDDGTRSSPQSRHGGGRASGTNHSPGTSKDLEYGGGRWRCGGRPSGLQKMSGLPFAGARQELARPESLGHLRQEGGRSAGLQLFGRHEVRQDRLGRGHTRRLSARSAKAHSAEQDAVSGIEDRDRAQGCDRLSRGRIVAGGRPRCRATRRSLRRRLPLNRRPRPASLRPATCRMRAIPCVQASPKAGWSISASAAPSTGRSIRFCRQPKDRWSRSS